jgi:hypothetical protein
MACSGPETASGGSGVEGHLDPREGLDVVQELIDGLHERLDAPVGVVAGDVIVELLPQALDDVRLGRVRRQEVDPDPAGEERQVAQRPPRLVDDGLDPVPRTV